MSTFDTNLRLTGILMAFGLLAAPIALAQTFVDVAASAGVQVAHAGFTGQDLRIGTGAAWFDYDNDGDLDLYMTQRTGANFLFENQLIESGTATFIDVALARGAQDAGHDGAGVAVADYDNDGDKDIVLANSDEDVLLENQLIETGSPNFTDISAGSGLSASGDSRGTSASWGDYDNDGYLDLYIVHHQRVNGTTSSHADKLYHNNSGDGTFTDVSSLIDGDVDMDGSSDLEGEGFITAWTDFDLDGDADIFLFNDCPFGPEGNKLWRNDGGTDPLTWNFTEISESIGLGGGDDEPVCVNAMGAAWTDYDRDGDFDYHFTDIGTATLIQNDGDGTFTDVTVAADLFSDQVPGEMLARISWGTVFLDYNLDGHQDLAIAAGTLGNDPGANPQPNMFYENDGDGTFTDLSSTIWVENTERGRTIVMGDYDADGDPDLFLVSYGGTTELLQNTISTSNHWLIIDLVGAGPIDSGSNLDGVGARVQVTTPDMVVQNFEVRSGSNLGGGDDLGAYFGLGTNTTADVQVTWPAGQVQVLSAQSADQRLTITEPGAPLPVELARFDAVQDGSAAVLAWETSSETGNAGFEVQHRNNGGAFQRVAFIDGQGTVSGGHSYTYRVADLASGRHAFRLKQVDQDGRAAYSPIVELTVALPQAYMLGAAYPNPFNPQATFTLAVQQDQPVAIGLFDLLGRQVQTIHSGLLAAHTPHAFAIDGSGLPSGIYLVRATGTHFTAAQQVTLLK